MSVVRGAHRANQPTEVLVFGSALARCVDERCVDPLSELHDRARAQPVATAERGTTTVGDLAVIRQPVSGSTPCTDVDQLFRADLTLSSVVYAESAEGPFKLVNRRAFYETLVGRRGFGWALYGTKAVSALPLPGTVNVPAERTAVAAGLDLLMASTSTEDIWWSLAIPPGRRP